MYQPNQGHDTWGIIPSVPFYSCSAPILSVFFNNQAFPFPVGQLTFPFLTHTDVFLGTSLRAFYHFFAPFAPFALFFYRPPKKMQESFSLSEVTFSSSS